MHLGWCEASRKLEDQETDPSDMYADLPRYQDLCAVKRPIHLDSSLTSRYCMHMNLIHLRLFHLVGSALRFLVVSAKRERTWLRSVSSKDEEAGLWLQGRSVNSANSKVVTLYKRSIGSETSMYCCCQRYAMIRFPRRLIFPRVLTLDEGGADGGCCQCGEITCAADEGAPSFLPADLNSDTVCGGSRLLRLRGELFRAARSKIRIRTKNKLESESIAAKPRQPNRRLGAGKAEGKGDEPQASRTRVHQKVGLSLSFSSSSLASL